MWVNYPHARRGYSHIPIILVAIAVIIAGSTRQVFADLGAASRLPKTPTHIRLRANLEATRWAAFIEV